MNLEGTPNRVLKLMGIGLLGPWSVDSLDGGSTDPTRKPPIGTFFYFNLPTVSLEILGPQK